jgi:hypothetical protein
MLTTLSKIILGYVYNYLSVMQKSWLCLQNYHIDLINLKTVTHD